MIPKQCARKAQQVDIEVGLNIRNKRRKLKLTQVQLARAIGVTFQQVQKYESAKNRVSASRLYQIARIFNCEEQSLFPPRKKV